MKGTACGFCLGLPPYHGLMHTNWKTVFTSGKCERLAMQLTFQLLITKLGTDSFPVCRARYHVLLFSKVKLKFCFLFEILTEPTSTVLMPDCSPPTDLQAFRQPPLSCTVRAGTAPAFPTQQLVLNFSHARPYTETCPERSDSFGSPGYESPSSFLKELLEFGTTARKIEEKEMWSVGHIWCAVHMDVLPICLL